MIILRNKIFSKKDDTVKETMSKFLNPGYEVFIDPKTGLLKKKSYLNLETAVPEKKGFLSKLIRRR